MHPTPLSITQRNQIAVTAIQGNLKTLEDLLHPIPISSESILFLEQLFEISNRGPLASTPDRARINLLLALYIALIGKDITRLWDLSSKWQDTDFLEKLIEIALSQPASVGRMLAISTLSIFAPSTTLLVDEIAIWNACVTALLLGNTQYLQQILRSANLTLEDISKDEAKNYLAFLADLLEIASILNESEKKLEIITLLIIYGASTHQLTANVINDIYQNLSYESKLYFSFMPLAAAVNNQIYQKIVEEYKNDRIDLVIPLISFLRSHDISCENIVNSDCYKRFADLIMKKYSAELSSEGTDTADNIAIIKSYVPVDILLDMAFASHNELVYKAISSDLICALKSASTAPRLNLSTTISSRF
jgi:hypothetical protein